MTFLGDPFVITVIAASYIIIGLRFDHMLLVMSGIGIPFTVLIGAGLKILFERTRPTTEYAMNMRIKTFSFPSGHSSGSTIAYGLTAATVLNHHQYGWILALVIGAVPLFVGISRVYLGAHFPTDVIAGWLLGIVMIVAVLQLERLVL